MACLQWAVVRGGVVVGMVVRWGAIRKYVFESEFYPNTIFTREERRWEWSEVAGSCGGGGQCSGLA